MFPKARVCECVGVRVRGCMCVRVRVCVSSESRAFFFESITLAVQKATVVPTGTALVNEPRYPKTRPGGFGNGRPVPAHLTQAPHLPAPRFELLHNCVLQAVGRLWSCVSSMGSGYNKSWHLGTEGERHPDHYISLKGIAGRCWPALLCDAM